MWGLLTGDLIMTGDGRKSRVAVGCKCLHRLETAQSKSGALKRPAASTHSRITHSGEVLASASMDHTVRIWDLVRHAKIENGKWLHLAALQQYSCMASSDKTVSLWDARSSFCVQTSYGHQSSCNHAAFDPKGRDGGVYRCKWDRKDLHKVSEYATIDVEHQMGASSFSPPWLLSSFSVTLYDLATSKEVDPIREFQGHTDAIQAVVLDRAGKYMASGAIAI
ncbi:hypothetical protein SELMODRAFT_425818 [Selaginella moellendorffii]|uniref:Peroxin-7 n=1 Tax=Selaginella moellendorffii TaxID=88036 RepID=D8SUE3_SELML|nr:hypothetical protein SELMODRAFT_425818 [Selaginella moellendorffii]